MNDNRADTAGFDHTNRPTRWTQREQDFLETLHRVLPKLIDDSKIPDYYADRMPSVQSHNAKQEKPIAKCIRDHADLDQVVCDEGRGFKSSALRPRVSSSLSAHSESTASTVFTFPQAMEKFTNYARSYQTLQIQELVLLDKRLRSNIENLGREPAIRTAVSIHRAALYHAFAACAHGLWAFHHALMAFGDEFYESACLEPLNALAVYTDAQANIIDGKNITAGILGEQEIQLYLIGILPALSEGFDAAVRGLSKFVDTGIPAITAAQQTESARYLTMTGVATFFSAVTATTLQLSYAYATHPGSPLAVAVNALWYAALVFSTASAVNSLLGLTWRQTPEATLVRQLPTWAALWLVRGPMISLVVASVAFSIGVCLFAFSSSQHIITSTLTAIFTAAHGFALFALARLYIYDQRQLGRLPFFSDSQSELKSIANLEALIHDTQSPLGSVPAPLDDHLPPWADGNGILHINEERPAGPKDYKAKLEHVIEMQPVQAAVAGELNAVPTFEQPWACACVHDMATTSISAESPVTGLGLKFGFEAHPTSSIARPIPGSSASRVVEIPNSVCRRATSNGNASLTGSEYQGHLQTEHCARHGLLVKCASTEVLQ
ncbi:hypothetical protein EW145_g1829 [Phellinidium pouzarii]|uniref:Uncharacterized protein n=1 Tax=Phellinidium pouzarii TaxID=167371 RepID=A0A4V3XDG5_9AGAM|nr:hypothetical protein EW145_g1829 [Phellinidium pouzarii]